MFAFLGSSYSCSCSSAGLAWVLQASFKAKKDCSRMFAVLALCVLIIYLLMKKDEFLDILCFLSWDLFKEGFHRWLKLFSNRNHWATLLNSYPLMVSIFYCFYEKSALNMKVLFIDIYSYQWHIYSISSDTTLSSSFWTSQCEFLHVTGCLLQHFK